LKGAISMPENIFANTGTKVSVLFIDKQNKSENMTFIDATKLGKTIKGANKQKKTLLSTDDEKKIINTFINNIAVDDFSVSVSKDDIINKKYSFSAGHYFQIKLNFTKISLKEFENNNEIFKKDLSKLLKENQKIEEEIFLNLKKINYEN